MREPDLNKVPGRSAMKGTKKKEDFQRQLEKQLAEKHLHQYHHTDPAGDGQQHNRDWEGSGASLSMRLSEHAGAHAGGARGPPPQVAPKPKNAV